MAKALNISLAGIWRKAKNVLISVAGTWRTVKAVYISVGGVWRDASIAGGGALAALIVGGINYTGNYYPALISSSDGVNFVDNSIIFPADIYDRLGFITRVKRVNGITFLLLSSEYLFYSTDKSTWQRVDILGMSNIMDIEFCFGKYFICGKETGNTATGAIYYSADLVTWQKSSGLQGWGSQYGTSIAQFSFGGGYLVCVGSNKRGYAYTADGVNWVKKTIAYIQNNVVFFGGYFYFLYNTYSLVRVTPAGLAAMSLSAVNPGTVSLYGLFLCNNRIIAVDNNDDLYDSTDGLNWTKHTIAAGTLDYVNDITYALGKYWIADAGGSILLSSTDLNTWTSASLPSGVMTSARVVSYEL